jgi:hypothetical protein
MTTTRLAHSEIHSSSSRNPWLKSLDTLALLLALLNFGLVLFDLSYIRGRDQYFRYLPQVTQRYDLLKGIQPHNDTTEYLAAADQLKAIIAQQSIDSPQARELLGQLGDRSLAMISEDPFRVANKSGNLEKIKNRMRQHMQNKSAKAAFKTFWSPQHLNSQNWRSELAFFDRQFRPLIANNYYRHIDESGDFVDQFWKIDLWFMGFFALDILARVLWIRRRHRTRWLDALLWRWYDLFFLLPFWQIVRIIPITIRLHKAGWVNLATIQNQVNRNLAENIAGEVTELVLIQTFSVVQGTVQQGVLRQLLKTSPEIVDTNQIDELAVIGRRLVEVFSQTVLPQLQPDFEALIRHFVEQAIAQTPVYQTLKPLPGLDRLGGELSKQVAHQVIQTLSTVLNKGLADEVGQHLTQQLGQHFVAHLQNGLNQKQTIDEIETLLVTWIEELKLSLIQNLENQPKPQTLAQAESMRRLRANSPVEVLPKRTSKL